VSRPVLFILGFCGVFAATNASAYTLADGATTQCIARGNVVAEIRAEPGHQIYKLNRTAMTVPLGQDYQIIWNVEKLDALPPTMRDFLFFHECAHAQLPTADEVAANCGGLRAMRAAGRGGPEVEARIAAFYGSGSAFWTETLACANAPARVPTGAPAPAK
jgi:hypothetical protein